MKTATYHIKGMTCHACETVLTMDLEDAGLKPTRVDHATGTLVIDLEGDEAIQRVKQIIEQSNEKKYTVTSIE